VTLPVEVYTPERKAAFLLESWLTRRDYDESRRLVRRLGLDPDRIPHRRPS
jgi:hypothetical protein